MTPVEIGGILLAVFIAFYALKIFAKTTAVLGLVAVVLLGSAGWIGRLLTDVTSWAEALAGRLGADVVGSAEAALIGVVIYLIIHYGHGLYPKHSATQTHALLGLALGALIVVGVAGIPQLAEVHSGIVSFVAAL